MYIIYCIYYKECINVLMYKLYQIIISSYSLSVFSCIKMYEIISHGNTPQFIMLMDCRILIMYFVCLSRHHIIMIN